MEIKQKPSTFFFGTQHLMNCICSTVLVNVTDSLTCFLGTVFEARSAIAVIIELVCLENTESACKFIILLTKWELKNPLKQHYYSLKHRFCCQYCLTFPVVTSSRREGNNCL